jgi:hypothetical protein
VSALSAPQTAFGTSFIIENSQNSYDSYESVAASARHNADCVVIAQLCVVIAEVAALQHYSG